MNTHGVENGCVPLKSEMHQLSPAEGSDKNKKQRHKTERISRQINLFHIDPPYMCLLQNKLKQSYWRVFRSCIAKQIK